MRNDRRAASRDSYGCSVNSIADSESERMRSRVISDTIYRRCFRPDPIGPGVRDDKPLAVLGFLPPRHEFLQSYEDASDLTLMVVTEGFHSLLRRLGYLQFPSDLAGSAPVTDTPAG